MWKPLALAIAALLLVVVGGGWWHGAKMRAARKIVLPTYVDPPEGPRAPSTDAWPFRVGWSRRAEVDAWIGKQALRCEDRSVATIMRAYREQQLAAHEAKLARGETDAISTASLKRPSPKEQIPQVRLACDAVAASQLGADAPRYAPRGRLLFVFDDRDKPVRSVSFDRIFPPADGSAVALDWLDRKAKWTAKFGAPPHIDGREPTGDAPLHRYEQVKATWRFVDLEVNLTAMGTGVLGISVSETVEVPMPVRADAPQRHAAASSSSQAAAAVLASQ